LQRRFDRVTDPTDRFIPLAIRFRIKNGEHAGKLTRIYGGMFDTHANQRVGEYVSVWDPAAGGWTGIPLNDNQVTVKEISEQQWPFVTDFHHKWSMALGGRRSGKTAAMAAKIIILALMFPGVQGCVVSPTYRQSMNVWRAIRRMAPRSWFHRGAWGFAKSERKMTLVTNAVIVFMSADRDDSTRSEGSAWLVLDERQDISEEAFTNAYFSVSEGQGFAKIAETATIKPELREHYLKLKKSPHGAVYRMKSRGNPFISHDIFDDAEQLIDERLRKQELEAEWPEAVGRCYYPFNPQAHIVSYPARKMRDWTAHEMASRFGMPEPKTKYAANYYISIDPPKHGVVWKIYQDGTMHAIDEVVVGADGGDGDVYDLAEQLASRYWPAVVVVDPHDTKYSHDVARYFKQFGFRMASCPRIEIEYRLTAFRRRLELRKLLVDPRCKFLIETLNDHLYDQETGKPDKRQVSRINDRFTMDHIGDAGGYGVYKLYPAKVDYEKLEKKLAA
jgi:phage terminase large subunit